MNRLLKTDSASLYINYLERARELGVGQMVESGAAYLSGLVNGGEEGVSLAELTRRYESIREFVSGDEEFYAIEDFHVEESNPYYAVLAGLLAERGESLEGEQERYSGLIRQAVKSAKAYAGQRLQERVLAMGLHSIPAAVNVSRMNFCASVSWNDNSAWRCNQRRNSTGVGRWLIVFSV